MVARSAATEVAGSETGDSATESSASGARRYTSASSTAGDAAVTAALTRVCALFALSDLVGGQQWTGLLELDQVGRSR